MAAEFLRKRLFEPISIVPLAVFRVAFGLLLAAEAIGAVFTGWVREVFLEPEIAFPFIPFYPWLQPLPGEGMIYYYFVMGGLGILVMTGLWYRPTIIGYFLMWTIVYWMQKSHYNNHYYLLIPLTGISIFLPANRFFSLDVRWGYVKQALFVPRWTSLVFIGLLWVVYTAAAMAKVQPDWIQAKPLQLWFAAKQHYWLIGDFLQLRWLQLLLAYGGIFFDGLIIPALLWKRTRWVAIVFALFFHLFNSVVFQIGIFPYLMLFMSVFFFPPAQVCRLFFPKAANIALGEGYTWPSLRIQNLLLGSMALFFAIMIALPLRHHRYEGDVNWTESGHRMAWRMMLRSKSGTANFEVVLPDGKRIVHDPRIDLTPKQISMVTTKPDVIWQYAQHLKRAYAAQGLGEVEVYADVLSSLNGRPLKRLADKEVNLAQQSWRFFETQPWILLYEDTGFWYR
ncbi:MAG: HTTM domain-containing protein [Lunatimonas sp.]|uniref:HTTM domain-containing protein n=1 Tax=Lunatimonas sp. TaxID=2060141 RepID=UPI00263B12D9|nr:HTTM domain-containing protein [Lunatimonas sp.]MCC5939085.1 HTTM domain-containing protein [Lunatimonas sp.]